ncbi:MAG: DUF2254 domain-containing protein [Scytonema sp. PMC 1069.18]|nr:DUF2254 domain-containing protein [Scytonema sp. PMC 1069.18]MEC4886004.1 DUF2254 domain-containing protein [Scytonema sp. PMC 1070.18]
MKNFKLGKLWDSLHSSYWFIPTLMAAMAIILAVGMLTLDRHGYYGPIEKWGWIYTGGPDGARAVLSAVAGSMISVTATAFSITIVALQLAASNFGPRLLRNFMQDTGNQVVLGTFIATFIYSLLVLRVIHGEDYNIFVPQISVTVGIVLGIISIGVLIYFIHHASTIIQVSNVIAEVSADLDRTIEQIFPKNFGQSEEEDKRRVAEIPTNFESESCEIVATDSGYLQGIDNEKLMKIARKHNLLFRLKTRPGKFVIQGSILLIVWHKDRLNKKLAKQIVDAFLLGKERNEQQDVEFPIEQLVEIALRAMSPAVNDPFTAIRCIDRLSAGLSRLAQIDFPSPYRYDSDDNLRVIAEIVTFAELTDAAFNQIRLYSTQDRAVTLRLLEAIAQIAHHIRYPNYKVALRRHADMIFQDSREGISQEQDQKDIYQHYQAVIQALQH